MKNFDKLSLLHSSAESKVYSAVSIADGHSYILKYVRKNPASSDRLLKELALHQELAHDHIVHLKASFPHLERSVEYEVLVLEYCSGGSLDLVLPAERVDLVGRVGWLLDVARGLEHLHFRRVVHRDVKPENVMLARGRAKIGDLGLAKYLREGEDDEAHRLGTLWYSSPEVFEGEFVGCETDVWSFGVLCLEVIANRRINTLLEGQAPPAQRPNFPSPELLERIGEEKLRSLVKKMLSRRREKRPTMAAVVEKLDKRLASLRKGCDTEELQLDLPLEESGFDPSPPRPEWTRRIEPKKQKAKVERYKMKTRQGGEVEVRYDDYRQSLRVTFQKMEITYDYGRLPAALKEHFRGLGELNAALRASNTKLSFGTNGALVFPFRARLPYDPLRALSRSMTKSDRSSLTVQSNREQDFPPVPVDREANLFKKYQQEQERVILEEEENNSSLGEKLSGHSGSRSGGKSYKFGEKIRDNRENDNQEHKNLGGIEEEDKHVEQPPVLQQTQPQQTQVSPPPPPPEPQPVEIQIVEPEVTNVHRPNIPQANDFPPQQQQIPEPLYRPSYPPPPEQSLPAEAIGELQSQIALLQQVEGPQRTLLPDHYMNLSHMHYRNRELERSQQCLRKAIDHYEQTHRFYSDQCAKAHYYLAKIYLAEGEDDDGLLTRGQDEEGEEELNLEARELRADEEKGLRELETAINILSVLSSYDFATFSKVYTAIGEIYLRANSLILAEDYFVNALRRIKDPTGRKQKRLAFKPTLNLGKVFLRWQNFSDARPYFEQALQLQPKGEGPLTEISIRNHLQACCLALRDSGAGLEHIDRIMALVRSLESNARLGAIGAKLMLVMRREYKNWGAFLLDDRSPGVKRHLLTSLRLLDEYFPEDEITRATLQSRIDVIR